MRSDWWLRTIRLRVGAGVRHGNRIVVGHVQCGAVPYGAARERPSVELVTRLAPPRSLVDTLIAERDDAPHDAKAGFARELAYQVRALEAGHGRDDATIQLRRLVDAHMEHSAEVCRACQDAADRMVSIEVQVARAERVPSPVLLALHSARAEVWGRAIAARVAADDALGRRRRWPTISGRDWAACQSARRTRDSSCCSLEQQVEADRRPGRVVVFTGAAGSVAGVGASARPTYGGRPLPHRRTSRRRRA